MLKPFEAEPQGQYQSPDADTLQRRIPHRNVNLHVLLVESNPDLAVVESIGIRSDRNKQIVVYVAKTPQEGLQRARDRRTRIDVGIVNLNRSVEAGVRVLDAVVQKNPLAVRAAISDRVSSGLNSTQDVDFEDPNIVKTRTDQLIGMPFDPTVVFSHIVETAVERKQQHASANGKSL